MAVDYKLTYFNIRGFGELSRLMFIAADVPFEDIRIPYNKPTPDSLPIIPPELKQKLPYGQLPILQDGTTLISQSAAIARHLARKFNFYGANELEMVRIDEIMDAAKDFEFSCGKMFFAKNEEAKAEAIEEIQKGPVPKYLGKFNEILEKNQTGYLVGDSISLADFYIFNVIGYVEPYSGVDLTEKYPSLKALINKIANIPKIKEWIEKRPKSLF